MRVVAHRLFLIFAALAFVAGGTLALAMPVALAAEPCPHEHEHAMGDAGHHQHQTPTSPKHRHDAAGCLCCSLGGCAGMPDLVSNPSVAVPYAALQVVYYDRSSHLSSRSLLPEPAPPRTIALS